MMTGLAGGAGAPARTSRLRLGLAAALGVLLVGSAVTAGTTLAAPEMQAPKLMLRINGQLSATTIPVRVSWPKAPTNGSKVSRYSLERSAEGGPWVSVKLAKALSRAVIVRLPPWQSHRFRVRATYANGSVGPWATTDPHWLAYAHETDLAVSYTSSWTSHNDSKAHGGTRTSSTAGGASASFTFTGTHVGWVSRYGPDRGRARVYIDGALLTTVDLRRNKVRHRRVAFRAAWAKEATRTLTVVVEGTAGRPRVDVDAFVTLGSPASATLVGAGDIGYCGRTAPELTAQLIEAIDGIVYTTGDNAYPHGTAAQFAECYDPSWGRFKDRTRPSPGNHDYATSGAAPYFAYFGANAGPPGRGWFTYQAGTWRIYSLNSENCKAGNNWCAPGTPQYDWLRADLAANPHSCVIAYWHRPRFSSGYHGSSTRMASITQLLYDHRADVVLAGHDHNYERFERLAPDGTVNNVRGIRHFVIGTGGAGLYNFTKPQLATTVVRDNSVHGVLKLDLQPGSYDWEFLPTTVGGFTDSGSGACH